MAAHLNEKEVENLKKQFLALDEDGSGLVTIEELKGIFKDPRLKMSEEDVEVLLGEFDLDGSGAVDLTEFMVLMGNKKNKGSKKERRDTVREKKGREEESRKTERKNAERTKEGKQKE